MNLKPTSPEQQARDGRDPWAVRGRMAEIRRKAGLT